MSVPIGLGRPDLSSDRGSRLSIAIILTVPMVCLAMMIVVPCRHGSLFTVWDFIPMLVKVIISCIPR